MEARRNPDPDRTGAASRPSSSRPAVLLTFDDGYRDYHDVVCPLLRERGLSAVLFVITDYLDHPRLLPWDRLRLAVDRARASRVRLPWSDGPAVELRSGANRRALVDACLAHFRTVSGETRARLVEDLVRALDPDRIDQERHTMTWDEVRAVRDVTTIDAHTHTHPPLSQVEPRVVEDEIRISRDRIADQTGRAPTLFAYPHGLCTSAAKALLPGLGFSVGFTATAGRIDASTDWLEAPRLGVTRTVPTGWMTAHSWRQ